ncbi:MAG: histidine kinase [Candidatus Nomurabacteria bacterium]
MNNYNSIREEVNKLKLDYDKLSDYELLSIAVQKQRNQILASALGVSQTDNHPSFIEDIAIHLRDSEKYSIIENNEDTKTKK